MRHTVLLDATPSADNSPVSWAPFSQHEVTHWQLTSLVPLVQKFDFFWNREKLEEGLLMPKTHFGYITTVVPKYTVPYSSNIYGHAFIHQIFII